MSNSVLPTITIDLVSSRQIFPILSVTNAQIFRFWIVAPPEMFYVAFSTLSYSIVFLGPSRLGLWKFLM